LPTLFLYSNLSEGIENGYIKKNLRATSSTHTEVAEFMAGNRAQFRLIIVAAMRSKQLVAARPPIEPDPLRAGTPALPSRKLSAGSCLLRFLIRSIDQVANRCGTGISLWLRRAVTTLESRADHRQDHKMNGLRVYIILM